MQLSIRKFEMNFKNICLQFCLYYKNPWRNRL